MKYKMMKIAGICFLLIRVISACGGLPNSTFHSALQTQPYLTSLTPSPGGTLNQLDRIEMTFSAPIDKNSVHSKSILIVAGEIDTTQYSDSNDLEKDIDEAKLVPMGGQFITETDPHRVIWIPDSPFLQGSYSLIITPRLEGENHTPFNQQPGQIPTPFFALFQLGQADRVGSTANSNTSSGIQNNSTISKIRPTSLIIDEVLYDASASDTDGNEFIELFGTPNTNISGYQVVIVNGADGEILKVINLPENSQIKDRGIFLIADSRTNQPTVSNILGADLLDNFDPQNGPDAIQLLDDQGHLLDAVTYGTGSVSTAKNGLATGEGAPAPNVVAGHSISRVDGKDSNDNATDFIDLANPTPGTLFILDPPVTQNPAEVSPTPTQDTPAAPTASPITEQPQTPTEPTPNTDVSSPSTTTPSTDQPITPETPTGGSSPTPPALTLVINEVFYDSVDSDTDGNEFIELFGTPNADISGYQVVVVNGADGAILKTITLPLGSKTRDTGIFLIADSRTNLPTETNVIGPDLIDNFDPQNGPDAIQLLDNQGRLLDAVAYGIGGLTQAQNGFPTGEGNPAIDVVAGHSISRINGNDTNNNATDFVDLTTPTPGIL
jgi:hypothetical protein